MIWIVGCEECEVAFRGHARKVDAAKDWNTRTPTSQIAVLRTALERDSNSQSVVAEFHPRFHALAATPADPVREAATALVAEVDRYLEFIAVSYEQLSAKHELLSKLTALKTALEAK